MGSPVEVRGVRDSNRGFRFGLRSLLLMLTLVGVWLGLQMKWIRDRHDALNENNYSGFSVDCVPGTSPLGLRLLGEGGFSEITVFSRNNEEDEQRARRLEDLFPEADVQVLEPVGRHEAKSRKPRR